MIERMEDHLGAVVTTAIAEAEASIYGIGMLSNPPAASATSVLYSEAARISNRTSL